MTRKHGHDEDQLMCNQCNLSRNFTEVTESDCVEDKSGSEYPQGLIGNQGTVGFLMEIPVVIANGEAAPYC